MRHIKIAIASFTLIMFLFVCTGVTGAAAPITAGGLGTLFAALSAAKII